MDSEYAATAQWKMRKVREKDRKRGESGENSSKEAKKYVKLRG